MSGFYCSCAHSEAAHVGHEAVVARVGDVKAVRGCGACLRCQGISVNDTVFHIVLWTEGQHDITMSLGLEGTIATRAAAERCAETYRECLRIGYETDGDPTQAFRSRVGILEIPVPDPRLKHPEPRNDVEVIVTEIQRLFERKLAAKKGAAT